MCVIRFKVIRGSRLLLGVAIAVLLIVLCLIAAQRLLADRDSSASSGGIGQLVSAEEPVGAEAYSAFAPSASGAGIEIAVILPDQMRADAAQDDAAPTVLIYHTHTHEAYEQTPADPYEALEAWRTVDGSHSVVRVGAELAELLRQRGFSVVHDTTDHEQSDLSTAYLRSEETLRNYEETFDLYIDLHRDAYSEGMQTTAVCEDGVSRALLMLLVGRADSFTEKPDFEENLAFATELTGRINELEPGLCKDVLVKKNRYNQHIGTPSILLEVGTNKNTLQEALDSMPAVADALQEMFFQES